MRYILRGYRHYFQFRGRDNRSQFWWLFFFVVTGVFALRILDLFLFGRDVETGDPVRCLSAIFYFFSAIPVLSSGWRRLNDSGVAGWTILILPLLTAAFVGIMMLGVVTFSAVNPNSILMDVAYWGAVAAIALYSAIYIATLVWIVRCLCRPSLVDEYVPADSN